MKKPTTRKHRIASAAVPAFLLLSLLLLLMPRPVFAGEVRYQDDQKKALDKAGTTYVIYGTGELHEDGNFFTVPKNKSSESNPITIILDNVNRSQAGKSPDDSFLTIKEGNYVIVKLRGKNYIQAGEDEQLGSNDGMAALHVHSGSTLKVTSEEGDGSLSGSLEAYGGGGKYGGAGIGTRYNDDTGTIIIAGGTINATGGHCAAGIGSGRDGAAKEIRITGGKITANGGDYAAGIGAGDNVDSGKGGDLYNLTISGGEINATGGKGGAGIGGSEGGWLRGQLLISGGKITAQGGNQASGIGCGEGGGLSTKKGIGSILITGGTITATGGSDGAGIGGGDHSDHLKVTIDQAYGNALGITANGGKYGAGIGMGDGEADGVEIKLQGGKITATGGEHAAGIGAGDSVDSISISGSGGITATGGNGAAGIGAGYHHEVNDRLEIIGNSVGKGSRDLTISATGNGLGAGIGSGSEDCCPITIKNTNVTAKSGIYGADIGTGGNHGNGGTIDSIEIDNCRINTTGTDTYGAGIGAGHGCECKKISIKDSECYGNSIGEGMGVYFFFWSNLGDMDSITIEDSTVEATWDNAGKDDSEKGCAAAGIGTNELGSIQNITIKNSNIKAKGINGGAGIGSGGWGADQLMGLEYVGGEVHNITIENSTVTAVGAEPGTPTGSTPGPDLTKRPIIGGGAGIGSGGNTNCQKITITDSKITAKGGKYAAGLGGGGSESIDSIIIKNSTVAAEGGAYGAGIGCGGSPNATTETVFHADVDTIYIEESEIRAQGGSYAAGIGAGCGAAMDSTTASGDEIDYNIHVKNCAVTAAGGEGGAGIGGGTVGAYSRGGHSGNILLEGTSQITANGGKQGAGVGGGSASDFKNHGGADTIVIDLTTCENTAKGPEAIGKTGGWLKATGGAGAAGIGAGGYLFHNSKFDPIPNTNDTKSIEIRGGYVKAVGGSNDTDGAGITTGAGAGIGGGAAGTRLENLSISGGWVEAVSGAPEAAAIGHGGEADGRSGSDDPSDCYSISGGTVLADTIGENATKVFDGGSIFTDCSNARNSSGTPVYRTTMKMPSARLEPVTVSFPECPYYGTASIFADVQGLLSPYLPASEKDRQTATVSESAGSSGVLDYYGTTTADGKGWLKMGFDGSTTFNDPGTVLYGSTFSIALDDDEIPEGTQWSGFTVSGAAELESVECSTSPGVTLTLLATGVGSYTVSAQTEDGTETDLYWNSMRKASFTGKTEKADSGLQFVSVPDKVYDSRPATDPAVETNSTGAVAYTYFDSDGTRLPGAPTDAGQYSVLAVCAETDLYQEGECRTDFQIFPAPTATSLCLKQDGASGIASARIAGLYAAEGTVTFVIKQEGKDDKTFSVPVAEGTNCAEITWEPVDAGTYTVDAEFIPSSNNYTGSSDSATGNKDLATRTIEGETTYTKTYGDESFPLSLRASEGDGTWSYEVIWDSFRAYGLEDTISVDSDGTVNILHSGSAILKVTLSNAPDSNAFLDAVAYIRIDIAPLPLTISSTALREEEPVEQESYGDLDQLTYGMSIRSESGDYSWDDIKDHFIGSISTTPLPSASTPGTYPIPIRCTGGNVTINGTSYQIFFSRDYSPSIEPGTLTVTKRLLAIQAADTAGIYGGSEPDYGWTVASNQQDYDCKGLASRDTEASVFTEEPVVTRTGSEETAYSLLPADIYSDVLCASGGVSANYDIHYIPGTLTVNPADLSDTERFTVTGEDTVYNAETQNVQPTVLDKALQKNLELGDGSKDASVQYAGDRKNAGSARIIVRGNGNYTGFRTVSFRIKKAPVSVSTESAEKLYDGAPLTAPGTIDGIFAADPYTFSVTGTQTEIGATRNSYTLSFDAPEAAENYRLTEDLGTLTVLSNDIATYAMSQPEDLVYDGQEHRASVTLKAGAETMLTEGVDYDLSYSSSADNFKDVGTITVTATGKGLYTGTRAVSYRITKAPLLVDTEDATKVYDGTPLTAPGTLSGLVNGETATLRTTGSITKVGSVKNTYVIDWNGTAKETNYEIDHEDIGLLTVKKAPKPASVFYTCTQGGNSSFTKGSGTKLTFVYKRSKKDSETFRHFTGVAVDGKLISTKNYSAEEGSVILTLKTEYLDGLSAGEHTLRALFDDGVADTVSFTVLDSGSAKTGDHGNLLLWILLLLLSAGGMIVCLGHRLHKKRSDHLR